MENKPHIALIILDGFGLRKEDRGNAVHAAHMPFYQKLTNEYPHTQLCTSGSCVGLPEGQMGNSEVGHLNIGAGRIVYQSLSEINQSITSEDFFQNPVLLGCAKNLKEEGGALHLIGLASHGGVHSSIEHLFALLEFAKRQNLSKVYIHALLDGRDTKMKVALEDMEELERVIKEKGVGQIASLGGRFYGMDRDNNWDRTKKFYDAVALSEYPKFHSAKEALLDAYEKGESDEFMTPCIIRSYENELLPIEDKDTLLFFNFRPDRMRQIVKTFGDPSFKEFPTIKTSPKIITMMEYSQDYTFPILFPPNNFKNTLGEVLASNHLSQLRAAETEKYAHVTFFFNAMKENPYPLEERILVPSLKVDSYDKAPEMKAEELTNEVIQKMDKEDFSFLLLNYANPDMVGHSGSFKAAVKALEFLDKCLTRLIPFLQSKGFHILITADHGNAEQMINDDGTPSKNHTTFPVPLIFIPSYTSSLSHISLSEGILADLAPTILELFSCPKPAEMTGHSLLRRL